MNDVLAIHDQAYFDSIKQKKTFPLHIHWDGSIPAESLFHIAQQRNIPLKYPMRDANGNPKSYASEGERIIKTPGELGTFLTNFEQFHFLDLFAMPVSFMQEGKDIEDMALAHASYLASHNSPYAETRFAPHYHTQKGLSMEEVVDHAVAGFQKGKELYNVDTRLILCIGREITESEGVEVSKAAVKMNRKYPTMVLGLDLACEEGPYPPEKHLKAFQETFGTPVRRTVHAGEMCSEEENLKNIRTALYELKADGLGHAIPLHKDQDLIDYVVENKVRIESNPVSNLGWIEKIDDLHLDELVDKGVLITINPDDPAMIAHSDMAHNLYHVGKLYGDSFVDTVIGNSIKAAWGLTPKEKKEYLSQVHHG